MESVHAVGNGDLWQLSASASNIVVIDVHHAELRLQLHSLREKGDQLVQCLFCVGHSWVIHKNDTVSVLLNWSPALLVLEVTTSVPELNVNLTEIRNTWRRIPFEIDDSILLTLGTHFSI